MVDNTNANRIALKVTYTRQQLGQAFTAKMLSTVLTFHQLSLFVRKILIA
jgi:hypothetical protein